MALSENRPEPHAQAKVSQAANDNRRINSAAVRELCGDISDMTLWRWCQMRGFPACVYIGKRRYWKEADVLAWLDQQATDVAAQ